MGWQADEIMAGEGVWGLQDEQGKDLGVIAIWWGPPVGNPWKRVVNEWRIFEVPLASPARAYKTTAYGAIEGQTLLQRRASFQTIWNNYKTINQFSTAGKDLRPREWRGEMKADASFNP